MQRYRPLKKHDEFRYYYINKDENLHYMPISVHRTIHDQVHAKKQILYSTDSFLCTCVKLSVRLINAVLTAFEYSFILSLLALILPSKLAKSS